MHPILALELLPQGRPLRLPRPNHFSLGLRPQAAPLAERVADLALPRLLRLLAYRERYEYDYYYYYYYY